MEFLVLDPRPASLASESAKLEGKYVVGFEVTVPALAGLCQMNVDPQHTGGDPSQSAIKEAMNLMWAHLPEDATLVTVRADLDSVGAMAIALMLRDSSMKVLNSEYVEPFSKELLDRVEAVHQADCFSSAASSWQPRPLFSEGYEQPSLAAIARAVSDFNIPLNTRVEWMKEWLMSGVEPDGYREKYEKERFQVTEDLKSGRTKVQVEGSIAIVVSSLRAATAIGYAHAPIVIALNESFPDKELGFVRKFTVCQYSPGYVNLSKVFKQLSELEPGWDGSPTIGGSPQGESSLLTLAKVFQTVEENLI